MVHDGDAEKRDGLVRRALLDLAHEAPRFRHFAERDEGLSEVTARPPVSDVQLQDALEFGPRFLQASGGKQTKAEYSPQLGILRVLRDARLELANCLFPAAGKDQDPRQVVRGGPVEPIFLVRAVERR